MNSVRWPVSLLIVLSLLMIPPVCSLSCKNTSPASGPCDAKAHAGNCAEYFQVYANLSDQFISSPNFPKPYKQGVVCRWVISACGCFNPHEPDIEYRVELEMLDFEMEDSPSCTRDFVEVRDGKRQWDYSPARYCGTPGSCCASALNISVSSKRHLLVTFVSDDLPINKSQLADQSEVLDIYKGFQMRYRCLPHKPPTEELVMGPANYALICLSCAILAAFLGAVAVLVVRERRRHLKLL